MFYQLVLISTLKQWLLNSDYNTVVNQLLCIVNVNVMCKI